MSETGNKTNPKKMALVILGSILVTTAFMGFVMWRVDGNIKRAAERTEADFTTETFTVEECWIYTEEENGRVVSEYHTIQPTGEDFEIRLPFIAVHRHMIDEVDAGDQIQVKVLRDELEATRKGGFVYWFKNGDRQVMAYRVELKGDVLLDSDINQISEREANLLDGLVRQLLILGIPLFVIAVFISAMWQRQKKVAYGDVQK